ncbi:MAG TPA: site-2 protease family protein [Planctomycetota bacterium]|nr:site-2 protease family protein [Planctomycetota bacterium]
MRDFRIGSALGFEVRADFSWLILFFLILWTFTGSVFPARAPGLAPAVYIIMGVVGTFLFFGSLLAHELAHALVARAKGIPISGITLFIFGGISRMRGEAATAAQEFLIAIVGPLMSGALGGLFVLLAWLGSHFGWGTPFVVVAMHLAGLNLLLAVFNLLPGFPLDGGRVFRALVWRATGDLTRATRLASAVGRGLGYALVVFGLWQLFVGNLLGGIWLAFVGWFVAGAAETSYTQHMMKGVLEKAPARRAMTRNPETVAPDLTLERLVHDHFLERRYASFPVVEGERPIGLIALSRVNEIPRVEWARRSVRETMTPAADITVRPEEPLALVLEKMERSGIRRVLVSTDGRLEGIISARDIAEWLERSRQLDERAAAGGLSEAPAA